MNILPAKHLGFFFIPQEFLPHDKDEYYIRNEQISHLSAQWRQLTVTEIDLLTKNGNKAEDWKSIYVTDAFIPGLIQNNMFYGLVRIGRMQDVILEHQDLRLPVGITNSHIIACDIGDNVAIHHTRYLAHYIIGNECILFNIDEMLTTNHATFGNGIIKVGESENERIWIDIINEAGCRKVLPFEEMIPADAYIWAKYRDDIELQKKLVEITQKNGDAKRGFYGTIGAKSTIKNCRTVKDIKAGMCCFIHGVNMLNNLTIRSNEFEPVQIGEGVELLDGIIGPGCRIYYGSKAKRFIMGHNSQLTYGARLIHSILGDNSTIACCEVLNNLIFPAHEQHHNNSFLIASLILGQSNIAAGATIGSNHNSRANDHEIQAGRGFWPGLCTSIKHPSKFASYVLLAKGDYPAELNVPLPFSLVNNNTALDQLEIFPGYWWAYNMYALARNNWKFIDRDKRISPTQHVEFEAIAPDTIEEILSAVKLLEIWTARAFLQQKERDLADITESELRLTGKEVFTKNSKELNELKIYGESIENSKRPVIIIRVIKGYSAYQQMLFYYAVKNLINYWENDKEPSFAKMVDCLSGNRQTEWINMGGQLITSAQMQQLRFDIKSGKLDSWAHIHAKYDEFWEHYSLEKQKHAFAVFCELYHTSNPGLSEWIDLLDQGIQIQEYICNAVYDSRKKDYDNPFHQITFRNLEEMNAAIGNLDDNRFIKIITDETKDIKRRIQAIKSKT